MGATCLRNYFLQIHKNWSNQPSDASALKKGSLKLLNHQKAIFYSGDINEWDVSLLISVLRFSALSSAEVTRHTDIDEALRSLQEIRNKMYGHAKNEKVSGSDFKTYWEQLSQNLLAIGGSKDDIDATMSGK